MESAELQALHDRNIRVEADKAWETSKTRRGCIAALTYLVAVIYMQSIGVEGAYLNALIPVGGYLLSTLSLGALKSIWLNKVYQGH
jgi:hypothetical protein